MQVRVSRSQGGPTSQAGLAPQFEFWAVLMLVLLGFGLRVAHVFAMQEHPLHLSPTMDSAYHVEWARALATGASYPPLAERPLFRAPLYPLFLAGVFRIFGESLLAARLVQCGLGAATVWLVHRIGRRAFGVEAGVLAAAMAAIYWVPIYFDAELLIPTLAVPLNLLAIWITLALGESANVRRAAGAGFVWGLSAIARPNVLLFMPLLAVWLLWRQRSDWSRGFAVTAVFSLALLAPILPVTAWNTLARGDFVLISSQGGVNFWIGNNPQSNGIDAIVPGTRPDWWGGYHDSIQLAERSEGRPLRASEVSRHYAGRAWSFLIDQPDRSLPLLLEKLRLFWSAAELGNNDAVHFSAHRFSWVPWISPGFAVLAALGLLGSLACRGRLGALFPLWGFGLVYMLSVVAFFVCARFRVPVLPVLMILAAQALLDLWRRGRERRYGALAASLLFVSGFAGWSQAQGPDPALIEANGRFSLGVAEAGRGNTERAIELLRDALVLRPADVDTLLALGRLQLRSGDPAGGEASLARAARLAPQRTESIEWLLQHLIEQGRLEEAEARIESYLRLLERRGVRSKPGNPYYHLGRIRALQGDWPAARSAFEQTLQRNPESDRAQEALIEAWAAEGRPDEACRHARRWSLLRTEGEGPARALARHCAARRSPAPEATTPSP